MSWDLTPARLELLEGLVGQPYGAGGYTCWGLVRYIYGEFGVMLPEKIWVAERLFVTVHDRQPFDLVIFVDPRNRQRHVGVLLDHPRFIHSSEPTNGVAISEVTRDFFRQTYKRSVRFKEWMAC